jgi:Na+-transporting NADH:ubiquinone oxidoreductase subunit NqrB
VLASLSFPLPCCMLSAIYNLYAGYMTLKAVTTTGIVLWDMTPCSPVYVRRRLCGRIVNAIFFFKRLQKIVRSILISGLRNSLVVKCKLQVKAILVTGREGPQGCEMSRLPYFV